MSAYEWVARVGGEGGPLLICSEASFAAWGGAVLDDDYELDPACDYARVLPSDDEDLEAELVRFGADQTGLVWEMDGPGGADVAVGGDGLLVVRSWVRDSDAPRRYAAGSAAREREWTVAELDLSGGQVAVVWAPVGAAEVTRSGDRLDLEHMVGVGAVVPLAPGRYRAACGWLEGTRGRYAPAGEQHGPPVEGDDDWSCRWLRLTQL